MFGPSVQPTEEMKKMSKGLYILFFIGLVLSLCKFAGGSAGASMAFNEIIGLLLLVCGISTYNYCLIVVYIVLVLFNILQFVMIIGKDIQNQRNPFSSGAEGSGAYQFFYIVMIITFIYDIVACYVCFKAYKLFKYETLKGFIGAGTFGGNSQPPQHNQPQRNDNGGGFNAFQGQGVRIG